MSVRCADRNEAEWDCLNDARKLVYQVLTVTRPPYKDEVTGKIYKAGILGDYYSFHSFGNSILQSAKSGHGCTFQGLNIKLKDVESREQREAYFKKAISYYDSILRELDLCIYYTESQKKRKSLTYVGRLAYNAKKAIQKRIDKDYQVDF